MDAMRCPMSANDVGTMRGCRQDCAWRVTDEKGHEACAVAVLAAGAGVLIDGVGDGEAGLGIAFVGGEGL